MKTKERTCSSCQRSLPQNSYSASQWSKSIAVSRCVACVHGHESDQPPTVSEDSGRENHSSEAYFTKKALQSLALKEGKGTSRQAAFGHYSGGERDGQKCVTKWFLNESVSEPLSIELKVVEKTREILNHFNNLGIIDKRIVINIPEVFEFSKLIDDHDDGHDDDKIKHLAGKLVVTEPFIEDFEKYNNNGGWRLGDGEMVYTKEEGLKLVPGKGIPEDKLVWAQAMQALSHFSYHVSGGNYLLCDLQGGIYQKHFVLTDPAIHSWNGPGNFGETDLGRDGMNDFFSTHTCVDFCRPCWTRPAKVIPPPQSPTRATKRARRDVPTRPEKSVGTVRKSVGIARIVE